MKRHQDFMVGVRTPEGLGNEVPFFICPYVHRNEAGLVQSTIKEKGRYKVIDRIGEIVLVEGCQYRRAVNIR